VLPHPPNLAPSNCSIRYNERHHAG
jgi:hypothetical protein